LIVVILFLEVGFVLMLAPWSTYWDRNYFAEWLPFLSPLFKSTFVRGAVTGLGIVNVAAGVLDLISLFIGRHGADPNLPVTPSRPAQEP
jgi:hypothetical protein